MSGGASYAVLLTEKALGEYQGIRSNEGLNRVNNMVAILDTTPGAGQLYDSTYNVSQPLFDIMVAFAGHFGIYYVIDEDTHKVVIYFIEDQRRDPLRRFE